MNTMEAAVKQDSEVCPQESSRRAGRAAPTGPGELPSAV